MMLGAKAVLQVSDNFIFEVATLVGNPDLGDAKKDKPMQEATHSNSRGSGFRLPEQDKFGSVVLDNK